jgi:hypothetical protein
MKNKALEVSKKYIYSHFVLVGQKISAAQKGEVYTAEM